MKQLEGKVAFITGGSKGIGFGMAHSLASQGIKVALTSRSADRAQQAADKINQEFADSALGIGADVRKLEELESAVKEVEDKWQKIDVVLANAGVGHFGSIEELTSEQWSETLDINLTGVFNTIKATLDQLKRNDGYLITIASLAGANFFPGGAAYNASKFGLVGFTQAVMLDLRHEGVNVSTIMPGSVTSHFNDHTPDAEKDAWKIQPEDIGELVIDLLKMNPRALPSKIEIRPSRPPKKK